MDTISQEFIDYWEAFGDDTMDMTEAMGEWACKYCENQEHVNQVLDEIDEYYA